MRVQKFKGGREKNREKATQRDREVTSSDVTGRTGDRHSSVHQGR